MAGRAGAARSGAVVEGRAGERGERDGHRGYGRAGGGRGERNGRVGAGRDGGGGAFGGAGGQYGFGGGGLFGAYGARMTGQMMDQYAREVEDFGFVPIRNFHRPRKIEKEFLKLRVAIGISGWPTDKEVVGPSIEGFAPGWELEALLKLGNSISIMVQSAAWSYAKNEIIKRTVFASLSADFGHWGC